VADLPASSKLVQAEIFGPVVTIRLVDSYNDAVELAILSPLGLEAGMDHQRQLRVGKGSV
jgi:acyl-CoA reductase-like NAD-dependent aldehyde dehydrogenase